DAPARIAHSALHLAPAGAPACPPAPKYLPRRPCLPALQSSRWPETRAMSPPCESRSARAPPRRAPPPARQRGRRAPPPPRPPTPPPPPAAPPATLGGSSTPIVSS